MTTRQRRAQFQKLERKEQPSAIKTIASTSSFRVGIVGAGAIGTVCGLRILDSLNESGNCRGTVLLVGRGSLQKALKETNNVLTLKDNTGSKTRTANYRPGENGLEVAYDLKASSIGECDVIAIAVKTISTEEVAGVLKEVLNPNKVVTIISFQNGVRNAQALRNALSDSHPNITILSCVVNFGADWKPNSATFGYNQAGGGIVIEQPSAGSIAQQHVTKILKALKKGNIHAECHSDIQIPQYAKLLINTSNAINALSGLTMEGLMADAGYRRVWSLTLVESARVLRRSRVHGGSHLLVQGLAFVFSWIFVLLPSFVFRLIMPDNEKSQKSSMLQDFDRGRMKTEVDDLCGEFVRIAEEHPDATCDAPINRVLVELVHELESSRTFLSSKELLVHIQARSR